MSPEFYTLLWHDMTIPLTCAVSHRVARTTQQQISATSASTLQVGKGRFPSLDGPIL